MSGFELQLSPKLIGAEILVKLAQEHQSGLLFWSQNSSSLRLVFFQGRPEYLVGPDGRETNDRKSIVQAVRTLALVTEGQCNFSDFSKKPDTSLGIDTLGETFLSMLKGFSAEKLAVLWQARGSLELQLQPNFEKLSKTSVALGGPNISRPKTPTTLAEVIYKADLNEQRVWAALLVLGAITAKETFERTFLNPNLTPSNNAPQQNKPGASASKEVSQPVLPSDPDCRKLALEIVAAHKQLSTQNHYQLLGISKTASSDEIRKAYLETAKHWHSDRFAGKNLGPEFIHMAESIFSSAGEAQKVLLDPESRKAYDFVEERKAQGLPTDVKTILEAEGLFHKGQSLVRRGQATAALPILRQAVELNKGEAEFWAFFGFATYLANGKQGLTEAHQALTRALELDPKLDATHEFLGRIAHVEGLLTQAQAELKEALRLNPKNVDAERELRLLASRDAKQPRSNNLLARIFKR